MFLLLQDWIISGLDKMSSGIAFNLKTMNNSMKDFKFVCYHTKPSNYIKKSKLIVFINYNKNQDF